jgi:hypothetical protein
LIRQDQEKVMTEDEFERRYGTLLLRSWTNDDFLAELLSRPPSALKAVGLDVPADVSVDIVRHTEGAEDLSKQFAMWREGLKSKSLKIIVPEVPIVKGGDTASALGSFEAEFNESLIPGSCGGYIPPNPGGGHHVTICTTCTPCCSTA